MQAVVGQHHNLVEGMTLVKEFREMQQRQDSLLWTSND